MITIAAGIGATGLRLDTALAPCPIATGFRTKSRGGLLNERLASLAPFWFVLRRRFTSLFSIRCQKVCGIISLSGSVRLRHAEHGKEHQHTIDTGQYCKRIYELEADRRAAEPTPLVAKGNSLLGAW